MNKSLKILHLEDLPTDAELVERALAKGKIVFNKIVVDTREEFINALHDFVPDIILSDHSLPTFNSIEALKIVKEEKIDVPFILITATISEEFAVEVMKTGAYDYLLKDHLQRLPQAIKNAMEKHRFETERQQFLEQVIANEALLRQTESLAGIGSFNSNLLTGKVLWSSELYRLLEYEEGKIEPSLENLLKRVHPEDVAQVRSDVQNATANLDTFSREFRLLMNDGTIKYIRSEILVERNENNKPIRITGFDQDITKQKLAEIQLNKTLRELSDYKVALDESSIVSITDQKGIIKYANDNFCKISKYTREELIGHDHRIVNSAYHSKEFIRSLWVTIANGKIWRGEFKNKAKDGTYYWVDATIVPFLNEQGKPYQYVAIRANITKKKEAEEKIIKSEAHLAEAQQLAKMGSWNYDIKADRITWSEELYNVFGTNKQTFTETYSSFSQLIDEEYRELALQTSKHTQATGEPFTIEYGITTPIGEKRIIEEHGYGEKDNTGKVIRLFGTAQDITERKEEERIRGKITAEIIQRNKDLEQFSYIVSHNLRAPVANIIGLTNIVTSIPLGEKDGRAALESLATSTEKLDAVIKDLNHILQVRQKAEEKKEKILFSEILNDVQQSISSLIKKENVQFNINFSDANEMHALKSYMHSIFYNLVTNSIKYRQPGVPIIININSAKCEDKIILTFKDNGLGIDMARSGHQVFGLYKRFHKEVEGKGMGLYLVKTQVESLGGRISVESEVNKGTEFKIEFENN